ncbi:MAG: flagellar biosynthetic protein FliO [Burkholderiaceae bacterium]|nr:flagellar biosynthetic protein FliO [Burkholderiaceae bacterium]
MKKLHLPGLAFAAQLRAILLAPALLTPVLAFAAEQPAQSSESTAFNLFKLVLGLVVVLGMMAASAWALKRFGVAKVAGDRTVKIVGGVSVGTRERVMVVEVGDQWIVVGVAPGRVSSLATMPRQEGAARPAEAAPAAGNFAAWMKQAMETVGKRNAS